ncbi:MAG: DarT ssDNA thymidine ADP-ribosyltransferase family protein [Sedimentibacter sp.]
MKGDCEELRRTVRRLKKDYDFRGLLHFTDFLNLSSIISVGYLCSRDLCYANNIDFVDSFKQNTIHHTSKELINFTRFYYVEKNNVNYMENLAIPVYLLFSEEIICLSLATFSDGDADSKYSKYGADYEFFNYVIDWEVVFDKNIVQHSLNGPVKQSMVRKRRSELLIDEPVPLNYLKNIIFRCNADFKRACNLFGKSKLYLVEPHMFFNEKNYIKDYNIVYNKLIDSDVFVLHFSSNLPVENNEKHQYGLYDLNDKLIRKTGVTFIESSNTEFNVEVNNIPDYPVKFKFWFYGVLSIEETIG